MAAKEPEPVISRSIANPLAAEPWSLLHCPFLQ